MMECDNDMTLIAASYSVIHAACAYLLLKNQKSKRQKRRWWMLSLNHSRNIYNGSSMLSDLRRELSGKFENFCRMSATDFELLLNMIGPKICKKDTTWRKCIPVQERLAITLRFLASGDTFRSLGFLFKISHQAVSCIVHEVINALNQCLKNEIRVPNSEQHWRNVALGFDNKWNFPHCLGAVDGKHVVLQSPMNSGSDFYNYKKTNSIILLAVVDYDYNFLFVDIGAQGRMNDSGVFSATLLNSRLQREENVPPAEPLPGRSVPVPYVLVGDDAFALSKYMLKPYSGNHLKGSLKRVFNYRLCRARRIVENAFGIISSVFRIFRTPLRLEPDRAMAVTYTCTLLHNFLRKSSTSRNSYTPGGTFDVDREGVVTPGTWRQDTAQNSAFRNLARTSRVRSTQGTAIRDEFAHYFKTSGAVPWQNNYD